MELDDGRSKSIPTSVAEELVLVTHDQISDSSTACTRTASTPTPFPVSIAAEAIGTTPVASTDIDQLGLPIVQDLPRPFDTVSNDLAALGALSIDDFLSNVTSSTTVFDVSFYVQLPEAPVSSDKDKDYEKDGEAVDGAVASDRNGQPKADEQRAMRNMIAVLHEASHRVFGSSDCLKFEYMEEDAKSSYFFILNFMGKSFDLSNFFIFHFR
jgi:hypothetical protein